jgi:molybdopterin synthase catalytic subunit
MTLADRYNRQIALWGEESQQQLETASVLIAGVGGLGATVAELLTRAGVGTLILIDNGQVDGPDLNRQILYTEADIGRSKVQVASRQLRQINSNVKIEIIDEKIDSTFTCPAGVSIIADCLDNYTSRFNLEAGLLDGSFLVHGGIEGNQGQVLTLQKGISQPLVDIFAGAQQPAGAIPVSGSGATIIAGNMANELISTILGTPQLLNRFLIVGLGDLHLDFLDV